MNKKAKWDGLEKIKFIQKRRKELNEENPYALNYLQRLFLNIERSVILNFLIVATGILIFISFLNLLLNYFPIQEWVNFPVSDANSARYFFSAVSQSLAALLAISFTVLLIYLQISTDRYSIQTVKYIFYSWMAILVITIFLITMIYSFFELSKINDYFVINLVDTTSTWNNSILIILILTILCALFLIIFFYKTIFDLMPENFIKNSGLRIKKAFIFTLDFRQSVQIKNEFFHNRIIEMENVETDYFSSHFGTSTSRYSIETSKTGFVKDITIKKIRKCSKLLSSISNDCKLKLNIPIGGRISSEVNILGFVEGSDKAIIPEIERLLKKAYKIDTRKNWMLEDYNELAPLSSLTTKAIKDWEKGVAETALIELTDAIIENSRAYKNFGLIPSVMKAIWWWRPFLNESFGHLIKLMNVGIKESDSDIINLILDLNRRIGNESISLQDLDTLKRVTRFFLHFSYKLEDDFIDWILLYSRYLDLKAIFELDGIKDNIEYVKKSVHFFEELVDYYRDLTKIFLDKQTRFAIVSLSRLFEISSNINRFMYDNTQYQLELKLEEVEPESNEFQKIKNELEIIAEKEKVSKRLKSYMGEAVYSIGCYTMTNIEKEKLSVEYTQPIFDMLLDFFKGNSLEEIFNELDLFSLFPIDHWFGEYEEGELHVIEQNYIDRFYLLISALLHKKEMKNLNEIKPIERFNEIRLEKFKKEFEKLKEEAHIWDQLFEGRSQKYFEDTLKRLEECTGEREENLREKVIQAELSKERVEKVNADILTNTKIHTEARNFVGAEVVTEEDINFVYWGRNTLIDKIFFVDESVDSTTSHVYDNIGVDIGKEIGMGESEYLIKQIFEKLNTKENKIEFETFSRRNLGTAKKELEERGFMATTLLTSLDLSFNLWRTEGFTYSDREAEETPIPYGIIDGIEVYHSRVLPKEFAIIFDKTQIGKMKIREDLKPIITTDFDKDLIIQKELEAGRITEEQKEEKLRELDEKVNIKALEKIKFEFGNVKAGLVLVIKSQ
ncbi:MAG TPA: DUF2254 family protein [Desulfobacteria bacterium]|nr:DUF2254 family protein [Desulfobacteria bacterium]